MEEVKGIENRAGISPKTSLTCLEDPSEGWRRCNAEADDPVGPESSGAAEGHSVVGQSGNRNPNGRFPPPRLLIILIDGNV